MKWITMRNTTRGVEDQVSSDGQFRLTRDFGALWRLVDSYGNFWLAYGEHEAKLMAFGPHSTEVA